MRANELRQKFLDFFKEKGHTIIPSASLIPENDPTVLFTTAGMHPLVPYLLGEKHPAGNKLADSQKCIRTTDIDDIGDNCHLTFFEMLGNWSLGSYWKKESISWSWEFLTSPKWLGIDKRRLAVSVFTGVDDVPFDSESFDIWISLGVSKERIARLTKKDNWWGQVIGPCGTDTEIFYWVGGKEVPDKFDPNNKDWIELWNNVFMEYNQNPDGTFEKLSKKNIDTGMGLERLVVVVNGLKDIFQTDLFSSIIKKIEEISGKKDDESEETTRAMRIVADHIKASTFILAEKLEPSNIERGYVLRRLIRRAVRYGKQLGINDIFTFKIAEVVVDIYKNIYPEVNKNKDFIEEQLTREEEKFEKTLKTGTEKLRIIFDRIRALDLVTKDAIDSKEFFDLFQTHGFPIEMSFEEIENIARRLNYDLKIDKEKIKADFQEEFKKHQELSRAGAEQKFKGGLADNSEQTTKYHTTTHLLLAAMRQILGAETYQKGSNITAERLRFDFNYPEKLTEGQIKKIEDLVNEKIKEDIPVEMVEMPKEEAIKVAKISFDPAKYGKIVKVYKIGDFSIELCGGPHIERTGALGEFKIIKEESSSAGVRRIKAILR